MITLGEKVAESLQQAYDEGFGPIFTCQILLCNNPQYRLIIAHSPDIEVELSINTKLEIAHNFQKTIQSQSLAVLVETCPSLQTTDNKGLYVFTYSESLQVKFEPVGTLSPSRNSVKLDGNLNLQMTADNHFEHAELWITH